MRLVLAGSDLWILCGLSIVAMVLGVVINAFRPLPLPWRYETPAVRLARVNPGVVSTVTANEVVAALRSPTVVIVDSRPRAFFDFGHVPSSICVSKERFEQDFMAFQRLRQQRVPAQTIVYCSGGDCEDSTFVARKLVEAGFPDVRIFEGGWEVWEASGLPVEKESR